jgi:homoserine dehydrogenase
MNAIIEILGALTPIGIGICSLLGVGSVGKIILKIIEYKNDEKIRKEKSISIINSNFIFYKKLFDKIATNVKIWQTEQIRQGNANNFDYSVKMTIDDFDNILGESIVNFNNENGYFDIEEQMSLKKPLQTRGIY